MTNMNSYIVIEQVIGKSSLSTYSLNLMYDNHFETFSEFGFTEIEMKSVEDLGCVNALKKGKDGSTILYTLIKKV